MSSDLIGLLANSTGETLYMVAVAALLGTLLGLPLGVFLATSGDGELFEAVAVNRVLGLVVNATRSTPFIILVVAIIPFTRLLAGMADYTPTHFGSRVADTTWAHQVANAIILQSPLLVYAAHPVNMLANPTVEILKSIPSVWDETVVLPGSDIGKCAAFARRHGKQWFIGVINGGEATTLDFALGFLGRDKYEMIQLGDAPDRADAWQREEKAVTRKDQVHLSLRPGGGSVIKLSPQQ